MRDFKKYKHYRHLDEPIELPGYTIVGYFPYETAGIYGKVHVPRQVYSNLLSCSISIFQNKTVFILKDTVRFGTEDFALFIKDCYATIGTLEEVVGYAGRELETIKNQ